MSYYDGWPPYVSVAERRRKAERAMEKLRKKGHPVSPVIIEGRTIARTFWGKAWCENLESYSDYENRLPRGRTYVRNGSVLDLQIAPGLVEAQVSGSSIYQVRVAVKAVPAPRWKTLCQDCGGAIASLVELLQGRFSKGVMERICRQGAGLFPAPAEITLSCSCPDGAYMCKHVAAVLYGIGARLDAAPELLFQLRGVEASKLLAQAASGLALTAPAPTADRVLEGDDLAELFGLEMGATSAEPSKSQAEPKPSRGAKPKAPKAPPAKSGTAKTKASKPAPTKTKPAKASTTKAKMAKTPPSKAVAVRKAQASPAKPSVKPKGKAKAKGKAKPRGGTIG